MIIHILVDTSHVEPQDDNVVEDLDNTLWSTTNIFTFTCNVHLVLYKYQNIQNYINYIFHE